MERLIAFVAVALALLWQSDCLKIENGELVNRCGLWQRFSGKVMVIALGDRGGPPQTIYIEKERIIYRDRPTETETSGSAVIYAGPKTLTPISAVGGFMTSITSMSIQVR